MLTVKKLCWFFFFFLVSLFFKNDFKISNCVKIVFNTVGWGVVK